MNKKTIAILLLIFIGLGTYVYFFETDRSDEVVNKEATGNKVKKLLSIDPRDVNEIVLTRKNERIVFKKETGQWIIKDPIAATARNEMVDGLLSIFDFGIVREITTDLLDASKYGLDSPEIEFEIRFKNDKKPPQTLLLGNDSPDSSSCYGRLKSQSRIVLLGVIYKRDLSLDLDTFIEKPTTTTPP
ncbi:MAG: DUF4340 domain-containing protein [Syntrophales bacterium]